MSGRVLRLEPVPSASDPARLIQVVLSVAAGRRDAPSLAEALDITEPVAQTYLDAGVWLGLLTPGAEVQLTRRGMGLAAASSRRHRRLLAAAMWRTPDAAALVRGAGPAWTVERVSAALRSLHPNLSPERADRLAIAATGLLAPAFEMPHAARSPDVLQLALPLRAAPPDPDPEADEPTGEGDAGLRRALLDEGELSLARVAALVSGPAGPAVDRLIAAGLAARVEGGVVVGPALTGGRLGAPTEGAGGFLELLQQAALGVAFPSALAHLSGGLAAANADLRRIREGGPSIASPFAPATLTLGGLLAPGERPPRLVPDALSLRLRALTVSPAFGLLGALLLLDRRAEGRLRVDAETGLVRYKRKALSPLLELFVRFGVDQGWVTLRPASGEGRLEDEGLIGAAVGIGLARVAEGRLMLDEALFRRLQDDVEASLVLEALSPLAARLQAWIEHQHHGGGAPGLALFAYGTLLTGESNAPRLGELPRQPASTRGHLWVLPQGYPVLVCDPQGPPIQGERIEGIGAQMVLDLDDLEGTARGLYRRTSLMVDTPGGPAPAQSYVMSAAEALRHGCKPLELTDWRARAGRTRR